MRSWILIVFMFIGHVYFSQVRTEKIDSNGKDTTGESHKIISLDGSYFLNYYGDNRIFKFSTTNQTYVEFDQNNKQIGHGRLEVKGANMHLFPIKVSPYSLIVNHVSFEILDLQESHLSIRFFCG